MATSQFKLNTTDSNCVKSNNAKTDDGNTYLKSTIILYLLFIYYSDILVLFMANMQQKIVANAIKLTRLHQCDPIFFSLHFSIWIHGASVQFLNQWSKSTNLPTFPRSQWTAGIKFIVCSVCVWSNVPVSNQTDRNTRRLYAKCK